MLFFLLFLWWTTNKASHATSIITWAWQCTILQTFFNTNICAFIFNLDNSKSCFHEFNHNHTQICYNKNRIWKLNYDHHICAITKPFDIWDPLLCPMLKVALNLVSHFGWLLLGVVRPRPIIIILKETLCYGVYIFLFKQHFFFWTVRIVTLLVTLQY